MLSLKWQDIAFTVIDLLILYFFFGKIITKRVLAVIEKRKAMIEGELSDAENKQKNVDGLKAKYEGMLQNAHEESSKIVESARANAQTEYDAKVEEAQAQAAKIIADAHKQIDIDRQKTFADLQSEISGLALVAAQKIIGENSSDEANQSLYNQFLKAGGSNDANGK